MRFLGIVPTCELVAEASNFAAKQGAGAYSVNLNGPAGRYRKAFSNNTFRVSLNWEVTEDQYNYLGAFYRNACVRGNKPFLIPLILNRHKIGMYFGQFIPNTRRVAHVGGLVSRISIDGEFEPADYSI